MSRASILSCLFVCFFTMDPTPAPAGAKGPIKVGMADSMLVDVEDSLVELIDERFRTLMKEFTGLDGGLKVGGAPIELAQKVEKDALDLAVFQGIEFAHARLKHPKLEPLMISLSGDTQVFAQILVRKDDKIAGVTDLKGKVLANPKKNKEHSRLFLDKITSKAGGEPKAFFKSIVTPPSPEKALDALAEGKVDAVLADKAAVTFYQRVNPGRFARLQVLETSEPFPPSVVAYRQGGLSEDVLSRLRKGLLKANKSDRGQDLMATWNITSFEPVPADYEKSLEAILRAYPAGK